MVEQVAFPFDGESDIDELDVIGASSPTRSTTVVGDATPPDRRAPGKLKLDTIIIPARKGKRSRTPSLSGKPDSRVGTQKKQKMEDKKAVSLCLGRLVGMELTVSLRHVSVSVRIVMSM